MTQKIYLSATFDDLKDYRAAVYRILRMLRLDVISMEDYVAADAYPLHKCLADVAASDIYIGLIGWHYGYIPDQDNPEQKSITELEYRQAEKCDLPCLLFLADKNAGWPDQYKDIATGAGNHGKYITHFRAELEKEHLVSYFKNPDHLASLVSVAVPQVTGKANKFPLVDRIYRGYVLIGTNLLLVASLGLSVLALTGSLPWSNQFPFAFIVGTGSVGLGILSYTLATPEPPFDRNRTPLLQRMQRWVADQLDSALGSSYRIDLEFSTRQDAVIRPYDQELIQPAPHRLPPGTDISKLFDESGGTLLILGGPGSGKTTLLLNLTATTIAKALLDKQQPIPILFKLSSWEEQQVWQGQPSLSEWLIDEFDKQYDVPHELAKYMIETNLLLPLLDGLDDVRTPENRAICIKTINAFRRQYPRTPLVVSCRSVEYDDLPVKLRLEKAIEVQPLSREQIDGFLAHREENVADLAEAFSKDPVLYELATAPLMLTIMTQAYGNVASSALPSHDEYITEPAALREQIFDSYIARMLERHTPIDLAPEKLLGWLTTLASGMIKSSQHIFQIEQLQPSWLASNRDCIKYTMIDRLGGGLVAGLMVGIIAGLSYGVGGNLLAGLVNGMRWGLVAGLAVGLFGRSYRFDDKPCYFDDSLIRRTLLGMVTMGTAGALFAQLYPPILVNLFGLDNVNITVRGFLADVLFFGLVGAFGSAILHGPSLRPRMVQIMANQRWSWSRGLPLSLAVGIAVTLISAFVYRLDEYKGSALIFGLVYGLSVWIILGLVAGEVKPDPTPSQRIHGTVRRVILIGLAAGFVSGLASILAGFCLGKPAFGMIYGISSAALVGLFGAIVSGGYACLSHFSLRLVLRLSGSLPWDLEAFLDDAAKRVILARAGGGYSFIHRLLLEHIAGLRQNRVSGIDARKR